MLQLFQRSFSKEAWPSLQLPSDELVVAHANPNVVNFYDPADSSAGRSMIIELNTTCNDPAVPWRLDCECSVQYWCKCSALPETPVTTVRILLLAVCMSCVVRMESRK